MSKAWWSALLFRALDRCFGATVLDWVTGELTDGQLAPAARYAYALILRGAAVAEWRGPLDVRVREAQAAVRAAVANTDR